MSAYVKLVCDYCGESEIEIDAKFEAVDSIEEARSLLWDYGWDSSDGVMCESCIWEIA